MSDTQRRDRLIMAAAALVAVGVAIWSTVLWQADDGQPTEVLGVATEATPEVAAASPSPTSEMTPTSTPTASPTRTPTPTPTPTPEPEPEDETGESSADGGELGEPIEVESGDFVIRPDDAFEREIEVANPLPDDEPVVLEVRRLDVTGRTVMLSIRVTDPDASGFVPGCPSVDWGVDGSDPGCLQLACVPDPPVEPGAGVDQIIAYSYTYPATGTYRLTISATTVDPVLACDGYGGTVVEARNVTIAGS